MSLCLCLLLNTQKESTRKQSDMVRHALRELEAEPVSSQMVGKRALITPAVPSALMVSDPVGLAGNVQEGEESLEASELSETETKKRRLGPDKAEPVDLFLSEMSSIAC